MQNSVQFINALQQAGKMFDMMIYPKDRHGIGRGSRHLRDLKLKFIEENLLRDGGPYEYPARQQQGSR